MYLLNVGTSQSVGVYCKYVLLLAVISSLNKYNTNDTT